MKFSVLKRRLSRDWVSVSAVFIMFVTEPKSSATSLLRLLSSWTVEIVLSLLITTASKGAYKKLLYMKGNQQVISNLIQKITEKHYIRFGYLFIAKVIKYSPLFLRSVSRFSWFPTTITRSAFRHIDCISGLLV